MNIHTKKVLFTTFALYNNKQRKAFVAQYKYNKWVH